MAVSESDFPEHKGSRRIILLSDGTGNTPAKLFRTNVWRLYQALDLSSTDQVAFYDDGVGTSNFKPLALLGGAIGWGLKRNLLDLYTFLCRNYQPGDRIYCFGFSRGAFTVRVLVRFILSQGLVSQFNSDDDLRRKARALYRDFRRETTTRFGLATLGRFIRDVLVSLGKRIFRIDRGKPPVIFPEKIEFIGVWDTVDAYGIPIYELKKGIDRYIWPLALEDRHLHPAVAKACHAIGIDDRRKTFHPLLWDESNEHDFPSFDQTAQERLTQVFFAGAHSNIGGGYPDDGLSYIALNWMLKEAASCGLSFNRTQIEQIESNTVLFGKLYDSRSGFGSYYRFEPRPIIKPCDAQGNVIIHPKIHETILLRILNGPDSYAPLGLPSNLRVVTEDDWASIRSDKATRQNVYSLDAFAAHCGSDDSRNGIIQWKASHKSGILSIANQDRHALDLIWDTVWWRRIAYFSTLAATILLLITPVYQVLGNDSPVWLVIHGLGVPDGDDINTAFVVPLVKALVDITSSLAPGFVAPWIDAFRSQPTNFITLVLLLVASIFWGALLDRRIQDRALALWSSDWNRERALWFSQSLLRRKKITIVVVFISGVLLASVFYRMYFSSPSGCSDVWCIPAVIVDVVTRIIAMALFGAIFITSSIAYIATLRLQRRKNTITVEPRGVMLGVASYLRGSRICRTVYEVLLSRVVPAVFAASLVIVVATLGNKFLFVTFDVTGRICKSAADPSSLADVTDNVVVLHFEDGCDATNLRTLWFGKYEVTRQVDLREFDASAQETIDVARAGDNSPQKMSLLKQRIDAERTRLVSLLSGLPGNTGYPTSDLKWSIQQLFFARSAKAPIGAPMIKFGASGNQQFEVTEEVSDPIKPGGNRQIFVYLNRPVIGIPAFYDLFYRQSGTMLIRIRRVEPGD